MMLATTQRLQRRLGRRAAASIEHRIVRRPRRQHLSSVPAVPPSSTSALVDFQTSSKIEGQESQTATIQLQPGQSIRAESGSMLYMTRGIEMETSANVSDGMKRFLTGQAVFVTDFTNTKNSGTAEVALGTNFPSKILRMSLADYDEKLVCQKGAYLASNADVNIEMEFTKSLSAGFFGGQGFVLQKLEGQGDVLLQAGGTVVRRDLEEGERLRISSGCLVAMTRTVDYDVQMMPGFKNVMFGGEGLFVTTLTGPGTVWLQGMPPDRMISEIARRVPSGGGIPIGIPIGMGGGGGGAAEEGAAGAGDAAASGAAGEAVAGGGEGAEDMVAATDAAVEADRQATVATSGAMTSDDGVDSESPSALFGDAVSDDTSAPPPLEEESWGSSDDSSSWGSSSSDTWGSDAPSASEGFSEETTFSTDDDFASNTGDFEDDNTSFSSFGSGDGSSGSGDMLEGATGEDGGDAASSILQTLFDIFTGGDD